ncbi:SLC39A13 [Mytilus coruscus]|uniref:SLC39A13 n=1 Tax=Mytilus coruscus TaxID=42192 RepID=A0A6J8AR51_MYTCO|nr:SLC39A13 [Mytilus coruscus]
MYFLAAANKLKLLLSFAVGGLLGDVFLHLLPEAWESLDKNSHDHGGHLSVGLWVLAGILTFLVLEKAFAKEGEFDHVFGDECEEEKVAAEKQNKNKNTKHKNLRNRDKHKSNKTTVNGSVQENGKSVLQSKNIKKKTGTAEQQYKQHQNGGHVQLSKDAEEPQNIKISGYLNLFANVIDNFTHGLAVGGSFIVSNKVGFITLLDILIFK